MDFNYIKMGAKLWHNLTAATELLGFTRPKNTIKDKQIFFVNHNIIKNLIHLANQHLSKKLTIYYTQYSTIY